MVKKREKRSWIEERIVIIHYYDWNKWDFTFVSWLSAAIEKATIMTEQWLDCKIGYTDDDWKHIDVQLK